MKFGDLVVNLGLNANPFTKGLGAARGALGSFSSGLAGIGSSLLTFGGAMTGIAGVAGIAGLGMAVNSSMESIDRMAKAADKLGISTESFVGLSHAAGMSGVEMVTLESSMLKLTKTVSTAANGNAGLADKFTAIGLSVSDLMAMSPDKQFYAVAEALKGVTNQSDKVRVATELFGKAGADLLPVLAGGAEGLADMQADAEKLGMTFSRMDAAKVEEANDAISRMKSAFGGLVNTVAIEFAPAIVAMTNAMTEFLETSLSAASGFKKAWQEAFGVYVHERKRALPDVAFKVHAANLPDGGLPFGPPGDLPDGGLPFGLPPKILNMLSGNAPTGLLKGSREAIDRMVGFRNQSSANDPQRQVANHTRRMVGVQERMLAAMQTIANGPPIVVGGFT